MTPGLAKAFAETEAALQRAREIAATAWSAAGSDDKKYVAIVDYYQTNPEEDIKSYAKAEKTA